MTKLHTIILLILFLLPKALEAQFVPVGNGSYTTVFPGVDAASRNSFPSGVPNISGNAAGRPVPTNEWWSALVKNDFTNNVFNYPHALRTYANGLVVSYVVAPSGAEGSTQPMSDVIPLVVGVSGLAATKASVSDYSDWTVTMNWKSGSHNFSATTGMGMPFLYFAKEDTSKAAITVNLGTVTLLNEILLITNGQSGADYAVYAPQGSVWTKSGSVYTSDLNGKNFWSMVMLPPTASDLAATATDFKKYAFVFPKDTRVNWNYYDSTSILKSEFKVFTEIMEGTDSLMLMGLLPHQWANLSQDSPVPGGISYPSIRGELKMLVGNSFFTQNHFYGILPTLPYEAKYSDGYSPVLMDEKVQLLEDEGLASWTDSYNEGQVMNRLIQTARIADATGNFTARDKMLETIKERLEDWLKAEAGELAFLFYYNMTWSALIGYPAGHGQDNNINDHHFHWGYFVHAAAFVEQYQPGWAAQWGDMVNLLIADAANTDRESTMFPFLRSFSPYAGHAWANGFATFPFGNDQESSSESMQFNSSLIHWGELTGNRSIRDLGIYLYTTEQTAIDEYWFDKQNRNLKPEYNFSLVSRVWGNGYDRQTFWTSDVAATYGIEMYPIHGGSFYLGRDTVYARKLWNEIEANTGILENEVNDNLWHDVLWEYLAFIDPAKAVALYNSFPGRSLKFGISDAQTYYWLHSMNALGRVDGTVTADYPLAAAFSLEGKKTYVAHNYGTEEIIVHFSDGFELSVPSGKMVTSNDIAIKGVIRSSFPQVFAGGKVELTVKVENGTADSLEVYDGITYIVTLYGSDSICIAPGLEAGVHGFYAKIFSDGKFSYTNRIQVQSGRQLPFYGTAWELPGIIPAGYYDKFEGGSGQGISYFDSSPANQAGTFREGEAVDAAMDSREDAVVGYIADGEWLEYTVNVKTAGIYSLSFRYACGNSQGGGPFHLEFDGKTISTDIKVAATATTNGWDVWASKLVNGIELTPGKHILRLVFGHGELNLGKLTFAYTGPLSYVPPVAVAGSNKVVILPENSCVLDGSASTGAINYHWVEVYGPSMADISDSSAAIPVVSGLEEGVYLFRLTVSDSVHSDDDEVLVIVSPTAQLPPSITLISPANQTTIAEGMELTLQANADDLDGTVVKVEFFANGTTIGEVHSAPFQVNWSPLRGNYELKAVATDNDSYTDTSVFIQLEVTPPPPCFGMPQNGDFTWVFSPSASNPTITFVPTIAGTGSTVCILYYAKSTGGPWPGVNVKPNTPYRITAAKGETVYFYYTYSTSSGERNTLNDIQHFVVGNCEGSPIAVPEESMHELRLYPNPAQELVYLSGAGAGSQVALYDLCGRLILTVAPDEDPFPLNLHAWRPGVYVLKYSDGKKKQSLKLVKGE
ncbi:MAG: glycosyl hydrolase [Bacteroidales bacterium]